MLAFFVGPSMSRDFFQFVPVGALAGALVSAGYLLPSSTLGPETHADQSTVLGMGSVLGLLPGVWTALFVFENTRVQAWDALECSLGLIAIGWIPTLVIPSGRGRSLLLAFLGCHRVGEDAGAVP